MMESTQAMRATVPQIQMVRVKRVEPAAPKFRSQLRDDEVDRMKGFHLGGPEDIGSGWKMPPTGETFDARYGRWVASRGTPDRGTHRLRCQSPEERTSVNFRSSRLPPPEDPFC
jgi:hypothetical protein